MSQPKQITCETCAFWQDTSDRVYAKISSSPQGSVAGLHELRKCGYRPPPHVTTQSGPFRIVYTDKSHGCSAHKNKDQV